MSRAGQDKAALRKQAYAARKAAFGKAKTAVRRATEHLLRHLGDPQGRIISAYMPIRTELDPLPAMTALATANLICVPVIQGKGQALRFREWTPDAVMEEGPFGAMVPASGRMLVPDCLIVPLVGFDADCNRLGYGGGFYDRTLAELRSMHTVETIGFAFAAQKLPALPVEPTDQALDAIVTDEGVIRP